MQTNQKLHQKKIDWCKLIKNYTKKRLIGVDQLNFDRKETEKKIKKRPLII